jgi:subfamily B ATP-binding cassette protein MsbA
VTSDIDAIQDFITTALLGIVVQVLTLVGMIGVMFYINWRFTLVALSVAPVLFSVVYFYSRRIKKATRAVRRKESEMLSGVAEILSSIQVVQAFAREDYEERKFNWESRQSVQAALAARAMKAKLSPIVDVLVAIGTIMVLGYGARLAMRGELSIGVLIVFLAYLKQSYKPMRELSKMTNTISKSAIAFERIQEVMANESRVADLPTAGHAPAFKGRSTSIASASVTVRTFRSSRRSASTSSPGRWSRSSDRRAPARRRSPASSRASSIRRAGRSSSTGSTSSSSR